MFEISGADRQAGGRRIRRAGFGVLRPALLAGLLLVLGCGEPEGSSRAEVEGGSVLGSVDFAPELNVDLDEMERRPSGLYVQDVLEGEGREVVNRSPVFVQYTGWLPDGTEFDSSRDRGGFSFMLGMTDILPAWEQGLRGMRKGGVRRLVVPPELGYGPHGSGDSIPPNTPLVFEVELMEVLPPAPLGPTPGDSVPTYQRAPIPGDTIPGPPSGSAPEDTGPTGSG